jgi:broad specificity polyphosphatase/5'/3'-nucleotidase SurE
MSDVDEDTDAFAVKQAYVSVTPVWFDLTAHDYLPALSRRLSRD